MVGNPLPFHGLHHREGFDKRDRRKGDREGGVPPLQEGPSGHPAVQHLPGARVEHRRRQLRPRGQPLRPRRGGLRASRLLVGAPCRGVLHVCQGPRRRAGALRLAALWIHPGALLPFPLPLLLWRSPLRLRSRLVLVLVAVAVRTVLSGPRGAVCVSRCVHRLVDRGARQQLCGVRGQEAGRGRWRWRWR